VINRATVPFLAYSLMTILSAHSQARSQFIDQRTNPDANSVVVNVQVLNKKTEQFSRGLKKEDFLLYEDEIQQEIVRFTENEQPLSVILLLDLSGSMKRYHKLIKDAALQSLNMLKPEDEVALLAFSERTRIAQEFTKDKAPIKEKLEALNSKDTHGSTYADEALYQAALYLQNAAAQSRAIFIITDNDGANLTGQPHSRKEALKELLAAGAVVHGLVVPKQEPRAIDVLGLNPAGPIGDFVRNTGGKLMRLDDKNARRTIDRTIDDLYRNYVIEYRSSGARQSKGPRKVTLKLTASASKETGGVTITTKVIPEKK
jgi:VWFA-related protein